MKNRLNATLKIALAVFTLSLFFSASGFAQNNITRIYDDNYNGNTSRSSVSFPDGLLHGKNPTIYVEENRIINVTGDERPTVLKFLDANSFRVAETNNSLFREVKVITITLSRPSELNTRFDVSRINGFSSLQYIYVKCLFECSDAQIRNFLINANNIPTTFYKVVNPA
ncbi:hypothetical protein ACFSQP_04435 [Bizionia sediminis]|uniref:DUF4476 domain-containing protein n=1 Tax=Bizionia sediminis TaxID=1737064 RepID=A0ABW5KPU6_9FLAO